MGWEKDEYQSIMKKILALLLTLLSMFFLFTACYDDSEIKENVEDLQDRVAKLEILCFQMNANISSLQTIVAALQQNDGITAISKLADGNGYTVTFSSGKSMTIYNGNDGHTPAIGVQKDDDGVYYWTLDGDWLKDKYGSKVKAVGTEGITPQLKIEDGSWFISYDGGTIWSKLGKATGEDGDAFFSEVKITEDDVTFVLADGQVFTIPMIPELSITFSKEDEVAVTLNSTKSVEYTIVSKSENPIIEVLSSADLKAKVSKMDSHHGSIDIIIGNVVDEYSKVVVLVSDSTRVIMRTLYFEEMGLQVSGQNEKTVSSAGGAIDLEFLSNTDCYVEIPDSITWLTTGSTKAMRQQTITLEIQANAGDERVATVTVRAAESSLFATYTIRQSADATFLSNRDKEVALKLWQYYDCTTEYEKYKSLPIDEWGPWMVETKNGRITYINFSGTTSYAGGEGILKDISYLTELEKLTFQDIPIKHVPGFLCDLKNLKELVLSYCSVEDASDSLCGITTLEKISFGGSNLKEVPSFVYKQKDLREFYLGGESFSGNFPEEIFQLENLELIKITSTNFTGGGIPTSIGNLKKLKKLILTSVGDVSANGIPEEICNCANLEHLEIGGSTVVGGSIPENIGDLKKLKYLGLGCGLVGSIPESLGKLNITKVQHAAGYMTESEGIAIGYNHLSGDIPASVTRMPIWNTIAYGTIWQDFNGPYMSFNVNTLNLPFREFNTQDVITGEIISDKEILAKNKLTLLYVYTDSLMNDVLADQVKYLYSNYSGQGLAFLGVPLSDREFLVSKKAFKDLDMPLMGNITEEAWSSGKGSFGVGPAAYLFNSDGKFIDMMAIDFRKKELAESIRAVLGDGSGAQMYRSTDYSHDGEVVTYSSATVGKGIDLVFMGDAFVDTTMVEGGLYEEKMKWMIDDFFAYEPYKSMKDRFNVYIVKAVSPNGADVTGAEYALGNCSASKCREYAEKIPGIDKNALRMIVYSNLRGGLSHTTFDGDGYFLAVIKNKDKGVVAHEAGGHGFAWLYDEYVDYPADSLTTSEKQDFDWLYAAYGWGANVDYRNDPDSVRWAKFLADPRYAAEGLGIYEGAWLVGHGCYRPSENSIMRYNSTATGFNAPSREQIYKRIMKLSEGDDWEYDYEIFVEFDLKTGAATTSLTPYFSTSAFKQKPSEEHLPPIMIEGSWRDHEGK